MALFTDGMINNIAKFICNNTDQFLSPFCIDTFLLVSTFKNNTLLSKDSTCFHSLIDPVMLCHKTTEKAVKVFFDAILGQLPGLMLYMAAIGADGEKNFLQQCCFHVYCMPRKIIKSKLV